MVRATPRLTHSTAELVVALATKVLLRPSVLGMLLESWIEGENHAGSQKLRLVSAERNRFSPFQNTTLITLFSVLLK